jgi:hypothetical protein
LIGQLFTTVKKIYVYLSLIIFVLLATIGTFFLYQPIYNSEDPGHNFIAWGVLLIVSIYYIRGNNYSSLLLGTNKIAGLKVIEILTSVLTFISSIIILLLKYPIALLLVNFQFWYFIRILSNKWLCKILYGYLWTLRYKSFYPVLFKSILSKSWKSGIGVLFSSGVLQFSGIIYANIGDEKSVSDYLFSLRIFTLLSQFSQAPFYSKLPLMQAFYSQGLQIKFIKISQERIFYSIWLFFTGAIIFQYLGEPILVAIGSNIEFPPKLYVAIFVLAFAVERIGAMHIQMFTVTNKIIWHISNVVSGIIFVLFSVLLYNWLGPYSLPVGFLISNSVFFAPYNIFHSVQEFGLNFIKFEMKSSILVIGLLIANLLILYFRMF